MVLLGAICVYLCSSHYSVFNAIWHCLGFYGALSLCKYIYFCWPQKEKLLHCCSLWGCKKKKKAPKQTGFLLTFLKLLLPGIIQTQDRILCNYKKLKRMGWKNYSQSLRLSFTMLWQFQKPLWTHTVRNYDPVCWCLLENRTSEHSAVT